MMNRVPFFPLFVVSGLCLLASGACSADVTSADDSDALARDSTLHLQVLSAKGDSGSSAEVVETTIEERKANSAPLESLVASERPAQPRVAATAPRISAGVTAGSSTGMRKVAVVKPAPTPVPVPAPVPAPSKENAIAPAPRAPTAASIVTIPAGTEMSFTAGERICVNTNRVGDRFNARVTRDVSGVIPKGTRATGVVSSLTGPLGEEAIEIAIASIAPGGNSRRITARVTDIELDRRPGAYRCIPESGRITARLTRPLTVTM